MKWIPINNNNNKNLPFPKLPVQYGSDFDLEIEAAQFLAPFLKKQSRLHKLFCVFVVTFLGRYLKELTQNAHPYLI